MSSEPAVSDDDRGTGPPRTTRTDVRRATSADIPRLAATLARAFDGDPLVNWMLPRARRHLRSLAMFTFLLGSQVTLGETYSTADGVGASIWAPPGRWQLRMGHSTDSVDRFRSIVGANLARSIEVYVMLENTHPTDPHWYLATLGTHPDWQGSGIGRALIKPVLQRADGDGVPAYLESSKESNIPYYRRFGFEVMSELRLPNGGPTLWPMWRDPQGRSGPPG